MLIFVLAVVLLLSIVGLALAAMSASAAEVGNNLSVSNRQLRSVDGAMEYATNQWRNGLPTSDTNLIGPNCDSPVINGQPIEGTNETITVSGVKCEAGIPAPTAQSRVMDLVATRDSDGSVMGRARIKIVDQVNGIAAPGYSVEVCDWLLRKSDVSDLQGCST